MVLIGLLAIALACLVLGLALASAGWLIGSLVASVLAALVLLRSWGSIAESRAQRRTRDDLGEKGGAVKFPGRDKNRSADTSAVAAPVAPPPPPAVPTGPVREVVVIDGMPDYHLSDCARLTGVADTIPIPLSQALEDGFTPCSRCRPDAGSAPEQPAASGAPAFTPAGPAFAAPRGPGRQRRARRRRPARVPPARLPEARRPAGDPDPARPGHRGRLPALQHVLVGRRRCRPPAAAPPAAAAPVAPPAADGAPLREVWVADGFPEFHVAGCGELAGLSSLPIPYEQALEDGFQPCVVCRPTDSGAPVGGGVPSAERRAGGGRGARGPGDGGAGAVGRAVRAGGRRRQARRGVGRRRLPRVPRRRLSRS